MTVAMHDSLFGWRWLIPLPEHHAVRFFGFSAEEQQSWFEALQVTDREYDTARAKILLVNGDCCTVVAVPSDEVLSTAHVVVVVSGRAQTQYWQTRIMQSFPLVWEYGLLPTTTPRVVVPLATSLQVITALGLHRPGRLFARLGLIFARILARLGNFSLLRGRVLMIATRENSVLPRGAVQAGWAERFGRQSTDFALYLGTPNNNRKIVVLPLGAGAPEVLLKVSSSPTSRTSLSNEAAALKVLAGTSLAHHVPKLIDTVDFENTLTLYMEYRPRKSKNERLFNDAVVVFLSSLSRVNARQQSMTYELAALRAKLYDGLSFDTATACHALRARLGRLADSGGTLSVHRCHGDFAPWNCSWTSQGLFVFDWEASHDDGMALSDGFYYVMAPALLVHRSPSAKRTLNALLHMAERVAEASHAKLDTRVYLAFWLLGRVGQARLYDELIVLLDRSW